MQRKRTRHRNAPERDQTNKPRRPNRRRKDPIPLDDLDENVIRRILEQPAVTNIILAAEFGVDKSTIKVRRANPVFIQTLAGYQHELLKDALTIISENQNRAARKAVALMDAKRKGEPDNPVQLRAAKLLLADLAKIAASLQKPKDPTGEPLTEYSALQLDGISRYAALLAKRKASNQGGTS